MEFISRENLAAVVTTFNPGSDILSNISQISRQVKLVIVVDDSGNGSSEHVVDFTAIENAVVLRNETNLGIAAALNLGVVYAESRACAWVVTLDDDTTVSETYIDDVIGFVQSDVQKSIGVIACSRVERLGIPSENSGFTVRRTLITSGCVFSIKTFREVGGFDESLFIDLVDFDFCTRLRKLGLTIIRLNKAGMEHKVGKSQAVRFLGKRLTIYNHDPFRLYYQIRNVFIFARNHLSYDPMLSIHLLFDVIRLPLKALFFEPDKKARFRYLAAGFWDGCFFRGGKLSGKISGLMS